MCGERFHFVSGLSVYPSTQKAALHPGQVARLCQGRNRRRFTTANLEWPISLMLRDVFSLWVAVGETRRAAGQVVEERKNLNFTIKAPGAREARTAKVYILSSLEVTLVSLK